MYSINLKGKFMSKVQLDQTNNSIIGVFEGFLQTDEHQAIGNEILDVAKSNGISKLIIDTANLKVIKQETQQWIETDWFPRAAQQGIKFMAFLVPQDVLGKMSTERVNQKSGGIEIQHVSSMSDAKSWIGSK